MREATPAPIRAKAAFAGDTEMPPAASKAYEAWTTWKGMAGPTHVACMDGDAQRSKAATFHKVAGDCNLGGSVLVGKRNPDRPLTLPEV